MLLIAIMMSADVRQLPKSSILLDKKNANTNGKERMSEYAGPLCLQVVFKKCRTTALVMHHASFQGLSRLNTHHTFFLYLH